MLHARRLSLVVLSFAALAVAGCGGDDSSSSSGGGGNDEAQVKDVLTSYAKAVADRDGDKACGYLTKSARDQIEQAAKAIGTDGCADTLKEVTKDASADDLKKVSNIEVVSVKITGDSATAEMKVEGEDASQTTSLAKEDGDWKVATDAGSGGTATAETPTAATVTAP